MILNWALTDGEVTVAPLPSSAAMTSRASSYLPFRMSRRGESGRNGQRHQIIRLKKIWKASGKRQATLPLAKEKPSVSQLEIEKPVMQFAW